MGFGCPVSEESKEFGLGMVNEKSTRFVYIGFSTPNALSGNKGALLLSDAGSTPFIEEIYLSLESSPPMTPIFSCSSLSLKFRTSARKV